PSRRGSTCAPPIPFAYPVVAKPTGSSPPSLRGNISGATTLSEIVEAATSPDPDHRCVTIDRPKWKSLAPLTTIGPLEPVENTRARQAGEPAYASEQYPAKQLPAGDGGKRSHFIACSIEESNHADCKPHENVGQTRPPLAMRRR